MSYVTVETGQCNGSVDTRRASTLYCFAHQGWCDLDVKRLSDSYSPKTDRVGARYQGCDGRKLWAFVDVFDWSCFSIGLERSDLI
jgi:hypothetical protein